MLEPQRIENEIERLASLDSLDIVDTPRDSTFEELVELAAFIAHTPMAAVSLITPERQWFKSVLGVEITETERSASFCGHTIGGSHALVVNDTLQDERFVSNPFVVGEPHVRFYAGVPLFVDPGLAVGSLCVMDTRPRPFVSDERRALEILGRQAATQLRILRSDRLLDVP